MSKRAIALISGGLDSILAAKITSDQGFDIVGLYCTSAFSKCYENEESTAAVKVSRALGIDLRIFDMGHDYVELVRNPAHGYGKHVNPCIDCKIHMLKKARELMEQVHARFVITGEVLGQRPMSQRRDTLQIIERDADMRGLILRPLSAKLLQPTKAEQEGLVDRDKLLSISGRSRNIQLKLAKRYGIEDYSTPAGGCLLTDQNFSSKLRDLFSDQPSVSLSDIRLLTVGRHFRIDQGVKIVVGRDNAENNILLSLASQGYHLFIPHTFPGPVALLTGSPTPEMKQTVGRMIVTYSKPVHGVAKRIRFNDEIFDPGDPLPINAPAMKRLGADV